MSHFDHGQNPTAYNAYIGRKLTFLAVLAILTLLMLMLAISLGAVRIPAREAIPALFHLGDDARYAIIVNHIRLPHALAAILAGAGLAAAGAAMQSILRNPLGSPLESLKPGLLGPPFR